MKTGAEQMRERRLAAMHAMVSTCCARVARQRRRHESSRADYQGERERRPRYRPPREMTSYRSVLSSQSPYPPVQKIGSLKSDRSRKDLLSPCCNAKNG